MVFLTPLVLAGRGEEVSLQKQTSKIMFIFFFPLDCVLEIFLFLN
jgi:hypothetical protein